MNNTATSGAIAPTPDEQPAGQLFRKKPVVITAIQLPPAGEDPSDEFVGRLHRFMGEADWSSGRDGTLDIVTLEGTMTASPGDWIIRGVKGEFYPCKPDIFAATYESPGESGTAPVVPIAVVRELNGHRVNGCNEKLKIEVMDHAGAGGANHHYRISVIEDEPNCGRSPLAEFHFQNGPIPEVGTNGVTQEALLEIVADRLRAFQAGPYACRENALALTKVEEAQHWLHHRTRGRVARGVEGTHKV